MCVCVCEICGGAGVQLFTHTHTQPLSLTHTHTCALAHKTFLLLLFACTLFLPFSRFSLLYFFGAGFLRLNASFVCQLPDACSRICRRRSLFIAVAVRVCVSVCECLLNCLFMFARQTGCAASSVAAAAIT